MVGHQSIINLRRLGKKPRTVFFFLGEYQYPTLDCFDPEKAILRLEIPEVWIKPTKPRDVDLSFVRGIKIQLLCVDNKTTIQQYMDWWMALVKEEPEMLIGIDTDDEFNIWRKE